MSNRPLVFVGSSAEGLSVGKAIQAELQYCAECVIWSQGVFGLSEGTLEALVGALEKFDFAILVLTPDDLVASRGEQKDAPRDNVLLELGMFIGGLGRSRTFMVVDRSAKLKLPTDLAGITPATFQPPTAGTMQSAVGPACTAIEQAIAQQGKRTGGYPVGISGSYFENIRDEKGITLTVTNTGIAPLPPFKVGIYHPKLGNYFMFPSQKSGQLLPDQKREHDCMVFKGGRVQEWFPKFTHDRNGEPLAPQDVDDFEFRIVLEDSDNKVLYMNKRIGRGVVRLLRLAMEDGATIGGTWNDWCELSNALPDE